jgi:hypothetical protein
MYPNPSNGSLVHLDLLVAMDEAKVTILKAFRFSENLADLFFLLLPHKFSSIAYVRLVNFNAEKIKSRKFGNLNVLSIYTIR